MNKHRNHTQTFTLITRSWPHSPRRSPCPLVSSFHTASRPAVHPLGRAACVPFPGYPRSFRSPPRSRPTYRGSSRRNRYTTRSLRCPSDAPSRLTPDGASCFESSYQSWSRVPARRPPQSRRCPSRAYAARNICVFVGSHIVGLLRVIRHRRDRGGVAMERRVQCRRRVALYVFPLALVRTQVGRRRPVALHFHQILALHPPVAPSAKVPHLAVEVHDSFDHFGSVRVLRPIIR